jgi:hypothetical protein
LPFGAFLELLTRTEYISGGLKVILVSDPILLLLPDSASLEEEALTLERRGHTGCLSLLSFGFDLCLMMCRAIDLWTDSVTRRPYAIDPVLLDVDA